MDRTCVIFAYEVKCLRARAIANLAGSGTTTFDLYVDFNLRTTPCNNLGRGFRLKAGLLRNIAHRRCLTSPPRPSRSAPPAPAPPYRQPSVRINCVPTGRPPSPTPSRNTHPELTHVPSHATPFCSTFYCPPAFYP
ncbi:hypothetical protein J6590_035549 [Homalodisca vitripennis]|nr:hypothetical protein J6590_035549 [Homalodisca vitripennis]